MAQWIECQPENQSHWFNSQWGHMPGLWARSLVGGMWERQPHMDVSLPLSPSLPLSKNKWIKSFFLKDNTHYYLHFIYFYFLNMFIDFRERARKREKEKERNVGVREKHPLAASHMHPDQGSNPQPWYEPWLGIKPAHFWCTGRRSHRLSHSGHSCYLHVKEGKIKAQKVKKNHCDFMSLE